MFKSFPSFNEHYISFLIAPVFYPKPVESLRVQKVSATFQKFFMMNYYIQLVSLLGLLGNSMHFSIH